MRISDWSSDVCSSDLILDELRRSERLFAAATPGQVLAPGAPGTGTMAEEAVLPDTTDAPDTTGAAPSAEAPAPPKIGRASCRESVCPYVSISVVAVSLQQKTPTTNSPTTLSTH